MAKRNKLDKRIAKREQREQNQQALEEQIKPPVVKNKNWSRVAVLNTYEEAAEFKNKILTEDDTKEVKIKRFGPSGHRFQVKTR